METAAWALPAISGPEVSPTFYALRSLVWSQLLMASATSSR